MNRSHNVRRISQVEGHLSSHAGAYEFRSRSCRHGPQGGSLSGAPRPSFCALWRIVAHQPILRTNTSPFRPYKLQTHPLSYNSPRLATFSISYQSSVGAENVTHFQAHPTRSVPMFPPVAPYRTLLSRSGKDEGRMCERGHLRGV